MTKLLLKLFVKNSGDTTNSSVRENVGKMSSLVGIVLNTILAVAKILVGALFGAISVLADGLNNLTDCGSNVVALVSFKMASKPADKEHPYGHARIEYVASMIVSFVVLVLAYELCSESVGKLINPTQVEFSWLVVIALGTSVIVKLWMFFFNRKLGKTYNSELLIATSTDSITDVVSTLAVLVGVLVYKYFQLNIDGVLGIAVALLIAFAGIRLFKETMSDLLGKAPDKQLIDEIERRIRAFDGVEGLHDLNVHNYGPNKYYASVHIEVDAEVPVLDSHDLTDRIERDFAENTDIVLVCHLDPVVLDDPLVNSYRNSVTKIVENIDSAFNVHDFRVVKGVTHTNLIFDVAIPFDTTLETDDIKQRIQQEVDKLDEALFTVVTVEKQIR